MLNGVYPATFTYLAQKWVPKIPHPVHRRPSPSHRVTVQSFIRLKTSVFVLASSRGTAQNARWNRCSNVATVSPKFQEHMGQYDLEKSRNIWENITYYTL